MVKVIRSECQITEEIDHAFAVYKMRVQNPILEFWVASIEIVANSFEDIAW